MKIIERSRSFFTNPGLGEDLLYLTGPLKGQSKAFVNDGYPDGNMYQNLFVSIPFFTEKEDTAKLNKSGLVRIPLANDVILRKAPANGFRTAVIPEQVPTLNIDTDIDVEGYTSKDFVVEHLTDAHLAHYKEAGGLKLRYANLTVGDKVRQVMTLELNVDETTHLKIDDQGKLIFSIPIAEKEIITSVSFDPATRIQTITRERITVPVIDTTELPDITFTIS